MNSLTLQTSDYIGQRLELEAKAFDMGFCDKLMTTLVADLLQGACHLTLAADRILSSAPGGLHIRKELREAIYHVGEGLDVDTASYGNINDVLGRFSDEIATAARENGIMASTGDCRGACKYNTGDSSEYRNYGW